MFKRKRYISSFGRKGTIKWEKNKREIEILGWEVRKYENSSFHKLVIEKAFY